MTPTLATRSAATRSADDGPAPSNRGAAAQLRSLRSTCRQTAHDLRAPLNAMSINLEIVAQIVNQDSDPLVMRHAAHERLAVLQGEVARLSRMLQTLAESGAPPREPERFGLGSLLREVVTLLDPQADRLGIRTSLRLPYERLDVAGARDELERALVNLLMNAIEAMPQGGPLEIELARQGARAVVLIHDCGVGIAPRNRGRLFRLHFTTKPAGSGIGLFTSRATIQAMGGELSLHSRPGRGTTARIALPVVTTLSGELACSTS